MGPVGNLWHDGTMNVVRLLSFVFCLVCVCVCVCACARECVCVCVWVDCQCSGIPFYVRGIAVPGKRGHGLVGT